MSAPLTDAEVFADIGIEPYAPTLTKIICANPVCYGCSRPDWLWPRVNRETPLRHRINGPRDE